jgi:hypothetical protein
MELGTLYFYQLISAEDGARTEPLACTPEHLANVLQEKELSAPAYVLVIGEVHIDPDTELESAFSSFPLVGTTTFIKYVERKKEESNDSTTV